MHWQQQEDFVARKNVEARLAHCIYYHDPGKVGDTYAGILWYWIGPNGTYLNREVQQAPSSLETGSPGQVKPGNYQHFDGEFYHVVDCLKLQGTEAYYVIFFPQKPGESVKWYYQEANEFTELVRVGRVKKPRFRQI